MVNYMGKNEEHVLLEGERPIYGSIEAGATVRSGTSSVLYGAFVGPLEVQERAIFTVHGSFMGDVVQNDGTLILSGQVGVSPLKIPGNVAVCVGSLLTYGEPMFLRSDGSLQPIQGGNNSDIKVNADASSACLFDRDLGAFVPLDMDSD
jgi:hypothetical protein